MNTEFISTLISSQAPVLIQGAQTESVLARLTELIGPFTLVDARDAAFESNDKELVQGKTIVFRVSSHATAKLRGMIQMHIDAGCKVVVLAEVARTDIRWTEMCAIKLKVADFEPKSKKALRAAA